MTWYRTDDDGNRIEGEEGRIGDDIDLVEYLRDERIEGTELGVFMSERFEDWLDSSLTATQVLFQVMNDGADYEGYFTDWVLYVLKDDPDFCDVYGFDFEERTCADCSQVGRG